MTMVPCTSVGLEPAPESNRGQDAGVLGGVNARGQQETSGPLGADDREIRPLVLARSGSSNVKYRVVLCPAVGQLNRPNLTRHRVIQPTLSSRVIRTLVLTSFDGQP